MSDKCIRRKKGSSTAEFSAVLTLLLPTMLVAIFVAAEAAQAYAIYGGLNQSAASAARQLAIAYGQDPAGTMANPNQVLSKITFLNIVQSVNQFSIPIGSAGWNITSNPPTVTVNVTFQGGQNGCMAFPNPDPLNLGSKVVFTASSTCRLE